MDITIDRPPAPPVFRIEPEPERERPLLTLRLSDGHSWAHEFGASSHHDLRDGAFEAFVACTLEWQRRANDLPNHQTVKRAAILRSMPRTLQLQVLDTSHTGKRGQWISANYAADPMKIIAVRHPGDATTPDAWDESEWPTYWLRCLRSWLAASELTRFVQGLFVDGPLADRVASALRRQQDDGAQTT